MTRWRRTRGLVSGATVLAVVASYSLATVAPAFAVPTPAETASVNALRTALSGSGGVVPFFDGLTAVGAFDSAQPALTLVPSSAKALGAAPMGDALGALGSYAGAGTPADLAAALTHDVTLADGRTASWKATYDSSAGAEHLRLDLVVSRTDVDTGIRLHSTTKPFDFSSTHGVQATQALHVALVLDRDAAGVRLEAGPTYSVDTSAHLGSDASKVDAAIGILGVTLRDATGSEALTAWTVTNSTLTGAVRDPNNDGFLTLGDTGELGAKGAAAGLGSVVVAKTGTLAGVLHITPRADGFVAGLPSANIDVTASSADLSTDPVAGYSDVALAPVAAFQRLSPFDLAQGMAQLAVTVDTLEHSRPAHSRIDADLPFVHGTIADLVPANEAFQQFLTDHVSPTRAGRPAGVNQSEVDFASVQDFLKELTATTGPPGAPGRYSVTVPGAAFDVSVPDHPRLRLGLTIDRAASTQPTDPLAGMLSAGPTGVSYGVDTVTTPFDFAKDDGRKALAASLAGRQLTAGDSTAVIKSVVGTLITLDPAPLTVAGQPAPASAWKGPVPTGVAYTIEDGDAKNGNVELADTLKAVTGLSKANAGRPQAVTTAQYSVTLPLVLDLSPALTGSACVPACPYQVKDPVTGIAKVVQEQPERPDRIELDTHAVSLTAKASLTSKVALTAKVGFVPVDVGGDVNVCQGAGSGPTCTGSSGPLMAFTTKDQGLQPLGTLINSLRPSSGADAVVTGLAPASPAVHGTGHLTLAVRRDPTFFDSAMNYADLDSNATPVVSGPQLARLAKLDIDPANPDRLFDILLADLGAFGSTVKTVPSSGDLATTLPALGTSVGQALAADQQLAVTSYSQTGDVLTANLAAPFPAPARLTGRRVDIAGTKYVAIGALTLPDGSHDASKVLIQAVAGKPLPTGNPPLTVTDDLTWALDLQAAAPPADLDAMLGQLQGALGPDSTLGFSVMGADTPDPQLALNLTWPRTVSVTRSFRQDLQLTPPATLGAVSGGGTVPLAITNTADAALQIPLTGPGVQAPASMLTITPTSSLASHITTSPDLARFEASAGSYPASIGDTGSPSNALIMADLTATAKGAGTKPVPLAVWQQQLTSIYTGNSKTCGAVSGIICASLPVFPKGLSGTADKLGDLTVALPTATAPSGATVLVPAKLKDAINAAPLSLAPLTDGLLGYLDSIKAGLDKAVAGGKVPLVGKDLQEGTAFLDKLRNSLVANLPAGSNPAFATAQDIKDRISSLFSAGAASVYKGVTVTLTCNGVVTSPTPSAVGHGSTVDPADSTKQLPTSHYVYAVQARRGGTATQVSGNSTLVTNLASGLTKSNYNDVSWTASPYADAYDVFRSTNAGGSWVLVNPGATGLSYRDIGPSSPGAPTNDGPLLATGVPCPSDAGASDVQSASFVAHLGQGVVSGACPDATACPLTAKIPIDLGLPGISLHATRSPDGSLVDSDKVDVSLGWSLDIGMTLDRTQGLLVDTAPKPELQVGVSVTLPSGLDASVAFLKAHLTNKATGPMLTATFAVDLGCNGCVQGQLAIADLLGGGATLDASLTGNLDVELGFDTGFAGAGSAGPDPSLPGITGQFHLEAGWASGSPLGFTLKKDDPKAFGFFDVAIDPGQLLTTTVRPLVAQVAAVFKPIDPILDTLQAPIPVLSDLSHLAGGDDVTLVTLAQAYGVGSEDVAKVLAVLKSVRDVSAQLSKVSGSGSIMIGDLSLDENAAKTTEATPSAADALIKALPDVGSVVQTVSEFLAAHGGGSGPGLTSPAAGDTDPIGLSFPVLDHPASLLTLLVGKDVELARFNSGPLSLGFTFSQAFGPIYAPPPVLMVISGSASVTFHIEAGFDTYGIRQAVESGKVDAKVLDSLYFITTDQSGAPIPVVSFSGELAAGAEVSVAFLSVGVEGGLRLTVDFTWNDADNDGKFRFNEFLSTALSNPICLFNVGGQLSLFLKVFVTIGFSPFDVSFDFEIAHITLIDFSLKPNCNPPPPKLAGRAADGTLYLFAGHTFGTDAQRGATWGVSGDETWVVRQQTIPATGTDPQNKQVTVQALGITETFDNISGVVLDARGTSTDKVNALFQGKIKGAPFDLPLSFYGGAGDDTVKTGSGPAVIDGGGGNDSISTGDRPDLSQPAADAPAVLVAGDGGADHITVGNAVDTVLGDGSATRVEANVKVQRSGETMPAFDVTGIIQPSGQSLSAGDAPAADGGAAGDDIITVGLGGSTARGGDGADTISVAQDSPLQGTTAATGDPAGYHDAGAHLFGGHGADRLSGGAGDDVIYTDAAPTGFDEAHPQVSQDLLGSPEGLTVDPAHPEIPVFNTVDTGTGNDLVVGSDSRDVVSGHSKPGEKDILLGLGGQDVLTGGDGTDEIFGGQADDYLVSQPAKVDLFGPTASDQVGAAAYTVSVLPDLNPANTKTLVGGGGSDRIYGGDGPNTIFGDHASIPCAKVGSNRSDGPDQDTTGYIGDNADGPDLIYGGNGVDTIQAGGGNDWVFAKGGADKVCGMRGDDHLYGGDGSDTIWGGRGDDVVQGDAGDDFLYGNENNDTLYGNVGADVLEGNADADTLFGGQDADTMIGGTSAPSRLDTGDTLYGDEGADVLIGDNGDPNSVNGPSFDLGSLDDTLGGNDIIAGGDGSDSAFGGLGADTIDGNAGDDHLEGGPGVDTIHGNDGRDDLIGGSSQLPAGTPTTKDVIGFPDTGDNLSGDSGDDAILGDNGQILDAATVADGDLVGRNRGLTLGRTVTPYDLGDNPTLNTSGGDIISGGTEPDLVYGQGGNDTIHGDAGDDYLEGGSGTDTMFGDSGQDDMVGGSQYVESGAGPGRVGQPDRSDSLDGGSGSDVIVGDNGIVHRDGTPSALTLGRGMTARTLELYDLGDNPDVNHSGADLIVGGTEADVLLGQGGDDVVQGGSGDDYAEGGPGIDRIEGNSGDDDLVGGSSTALGSGTGDATTGQLDSADLIYGGTGDDVALGDNGIITRVGTFDSRTFRIGSSAQLMSRRSITPYDLANNGSILTFPSRAVYGSDQISGGAGVDVLLGQDGNDTLTGEAGDDYAEGNGGNDTVYGDQLLSAIAPVPLLSAAWQSRASEDLGESDVFYGQDDLIGGSSRQGFRDATGPGVANDLLHGDGGADYELGDNGEIVRDILDAQGALITESTTLTAASYPLTNRISTLRYGATPPQGAAFVRHASSAGGSTRFCAARPQGTCEPLGAYGDDTMYGDAGDDTMYGQDGNDTLRGGSGDDDMYGELGNDIMFGDAGDDAMLGDRGGIVDRLENGSRSAAVAKNMSSVPQIAFQGLLTRTVTRQTDLIHDVYGDTFPASSTSAPMPYDGVAFGGNDQMHGGDGHDVMHGGVGDDLINGDSGGDWVFGDDGADVLWGGKGNDTTDPTRANDRTNAASPYFDSYVDYLVGGKGATSGPSVDSATGDLGADVLDWRPRGSYVPGTGCTKAPWPATVGTTSVDPCSWFLMTNLDDTDVSNNQHHQGIDWQYGGWDRDILQADVADNGPNQGDRLLDWTGAYNLYTHCNSAYGGYNDVRQFSPDMQDFLQKWGAATGIGQNLSDVTTRGTSAYNELALVYQSDINGYGNGKAFPSTPGHFDNPNACAP